MAGIIISKDNPVRLVAGKGNQIEKPVHWGNVISRRFPNIAIMAKKNSGKSTTVFHMVNEMVDPQTQIVIFCPSYDTDKTYIDNITDLRERGFNVICFNQIGDHLQELMYEIKEKISDNDKKEPVDDLRARMFPKKIAEKKEKPYPYQRRPYIIIFDDLGSELRNKTVANFIITNRHYQAAVIYSFHRFSNCLPIMRQNFEYICLFGKIPKDELLELNKEADMGVEKEELFQAYDLATKEPYNFLFVDLVGPLNRRFRINFG